jgi:hypothetical protein
VTAEMHSSLCSFLRKPPKPCPKLPFQAHGFLGDDCEWESGELCRSKSMGTTKPGRGSSLLRCKYQEMPRLAEQVIVVESFGRADSL